MIPEIVSKRNFLLIDLPVFPKGLISLSLPLLAGYLKNQFHVKILDLNILDLEKENISDYLKDVAFVGIKVSSQSFKFAKDITAEIKRHNPQLPVIWGGELPTLLPDECLKHADTIVKKRIEGCLEQFLTDLDSNKLEKMYQGGSSFSEGLSVPDFSGYNQRNYYSFMGLPFETSVGCDRFCNFCMVHTMQKGAAYKTADQLEAELKNIGKKFLNIIDYNLGMDKSHLLQLCSAIKNSESIGWMGEMCLESLDDDEILDSLSQSRCKIIYCGLESIDENALKTVNKAKTNHPDNYRRIIRKAQTKGINIASGFIIGIDGTTEKTFQDTLDFFTSCGLIYVKITFLTYNPGTFHHTAMKKQGTYLTDVIEKFDGNNLTYLSSHTNEKILYSGTKEFIRKFYSLKSIIKRAMIAEKKSSRILEFIFFNLCYSKVYFDWLRNDVLTAGENGMAALVKKKFTKSFLVRTAETLLNKIQQHSR